jgi:glycosyltransferase involved in cell wall biosynthesis
LKITFVLPSLNVSGGIRVILDHAVRLHAKGHDVRLVSLLDPPEPLTERLKSWLRRRLSRRPKRRDALIEFGASHLLHRVVRETELEATIAAGDVIIATWWYTAEVVNRLPARLGAKVYLVQGDESSLPYTPTERVVATLRAPLYKVAVSNWIAGVIRERVGDTSVSVVPNGVDVTKFQAPPRSRNPIPTLGFVYSSVHTKGCDLILTALARLRERLPGLRVISFSAEDVMPVPPLPDWVDFAEKPAQDELIRRYASCDAWLWGSRAEGFGLPILEAMACRTPVIATRAGAAPELLAQGGGRLVPCEDAQALEEATYGVLALAPDAWRSLSDEAFAVAQSHRCETATASLEAFLEQVVGGAVAEPGRGSSQPG